MCLLKFNVNKIHQIHGSNELTHPSLFCRILSVDISKHQISLSLAQHPTIEDQHVIKRLKHISYIPKDQKNISKAMFLMRKEKVKQKLGSIIKEFKVSGCVIGWPLEPTGQPGAACGRVLHLLDYLAGK